MKKLLITQLTLFFFFTSMAFANYGAELVQGAGNENGSVDRLQWQAVGTTFGIKTRTYQGETYLYPNNKQNNGGAYQALDTEIGKSYKVSATLLGTDANRNNIFTGHSSYITIEDGIPTPNTIPSYSSEWVSGVNAEDVSFTFVATSTTTYISLRSTGAWNYANARAISVKEILNGEPIEDTIAPVITLNGTPTVNLAVGETYTDAGATANDNVDGDITENIVTTSTVDTTTTGTYTVIYDVNDTAGNSAVQVSRTVVVNTVVVADTTAPVITLNSESNVSLNVGDTYTDAGATATDNVDGDLTANIITENPVNTTIAGTYTVTYDVNDTAGNSAVQVARTVVVKEDVVLDTEAPIITLLGESPITVIVGTRYVDLGAIATDNVDGNVTANIITRNTVDTTTVGTYTVTYDVNDTVGNDATQITRNVIVEDASVAQSTVSARVIAESGVPLDGVAVKSMKIK